MTWLDWTIAAIILFAVLQGFRRGTLITFVSALGVFVGYLAASAWYRPLADLARQSLRLSESWMATASFLVLLLAIYALIGLAITTMAGGERPSPASRLVGLALGLGKGALLAIAFLVAAIASPIGEPIRRDAERAPLAGYALRAHKAGAATLDAILPEAIRPFGVSDEKF